MLFRSHYCRGNRPKPGGLCAWMGADGRHVINLFTQEAAYHPRARPGCATTQHMGHALKALRQLIEAEHFTSVALPRLAQGVGGPEWAEVKPLVEQYLGGLKAPVIGYAAYHANQKAAEGL